MNTMRGIRFWRNWGLVSRLMLAVGTAIITGGGVQTYLLMAEGAAEHSARLKRELNETLTFMAPLIADQALLGEYAVIDQLLKKQVQKGEIESFQWTDKDGRKLVARDKPDVLDAPAWFTGVAAIERAEETMDVTSGGVGYGRLHATTTTNKAHNRLWQQFVKQLQIVVVTLFLAGPEQVTLPRQMFTGIRENINPTIAAVATLLILFTTSLLLVLEWLRGRRAK